MQFKNKSLKALTVHRDVLPKQLLKTIDKCKFQQENLELITVTVLYNCSQFVGRRRRRCAKSLWRTANTKTCSCSSSVLFLFFKLCDFLLQITNLRVSTDKVSELCAIINFICLTWLNKLLNYSMQNVLSSCWSN